MKMSFRNPAATASMIVEKNGSVYLVKRGHEPYLGMYALPGGFLECDWESLEETAVRELREETPFVAKTEDLELLCVNSDPNRDPRGHVIDHVYIVKKYLVQPHKDGNYDDAVDGKFFPLDNLPLLAFDHGKVLKQYFKKGAGKIK
jgi:8-oxo-dGTP diphosphatase